MIVNVQTPGVDHGTVWMFNGIIHDGSRVTFGVDWRMAQDVQEQLDEWGEVDCEVEAWQIL